MSTTLAAALAGSFMEVSKKEPPWVGVRFSSQDSQTLRARVTDHSLDLALIFEDEPTGGFARIPLFRRQLYLIQRRKMPRSPQSITLARVCERPLILPASPNLLRALLDRSFDKAELTPNTVAEMDVFSNMLSAVQSGIGDTILPKEIFPTFPDMRALRLFRLIRRCI